MKQYKGGYNVNRYDWKNKTTEHLLNDNNLADNHIPEWIRKNEIAAFWFWLIMSHTVPEKLKLNNESEFNSALKGVIVMKDNPMTIIPSSHETRLNVIGKWINALILYGGSRSDYLDNASKLAGTRKEKRSQMA